MGDIFLKDSKNRYHRVCIQFYNTSCGPASVAMVERIYKHLDRSDEAVGYLDGWLVITHR